MTDTDFETTTVAEIHGVGHTFTISAIDGEDLFDVTVDGGPVPRRLLLGVAWTKAMNFVRDRVATELKGL